MWNDIHPPNCYRGCKRYMFYFLELYSYDDLFQYISCGKTDVILQLHLLAFYCAKLINKVTKWLFVLDQYTVDSYCSRKVYLLFGQRSPKSRGQSLIWMSDQHNRRFWTTPRMNVTHFVFCLIWFFTSHQQSFNCVQNLNCSF